MDKVELFEILSCSKTGEEQHIFKDPVSLDCGHCICKSCIPTKEAEKIKCNKCGEINDKNLKTVKELNVVNQMIEMNLAHLCLEIEKQSTENLGKLKSTFSRNFKITDEKRTF